MNWDDRARNLSQRTDAKYSIVKIYIPLNGSLGRIELASFDKNLRQKTRGGDHWKARLQNKTFSLPVRFEDQQNGKYVGYFIIPSPGRYSLNIVLEHSLCEGLTNQPDGWFLKGMYVENDGL